MQETFIRTLRAQRAQIRTRWEGLLRVEKVNTPLANPDTLVFLFNQTLDEVFAMLGNPPARRPETPLENASEKNPLRAYFLAGEQALLESLVLAQATSRHLDPRERDADVAELKQVLHTIARREIGTLEGVLQQSRSNATNGSA
jgi:hypothetical protein